MKLPLDEIIRDPFAWMLSEKEGGDDHLGAGALFEELDGGGLVEAQSRVIVPKKGKLFAEDGSMKIAIIRPCISRGKRIKGMPPIYEPKMLEKHAEVFTGWPMYMDHLIAEALEEMAEQLKEAADGTDLLGWLEERSRSIKEIGGRVIKSWWDPELVFEDDEDFGFQPGGVVGRAIPQPDPKRMLEADPGILQTSINAWPTGARAAEASWDKSQRGMAIEGIRRRPMGSVDWVFRAGAGGRPLLEEDDDYRARAVSLLESVYSAAQSKDAPPKRTSRTMKKKLSEMNADELREHLKDQGAEHLIEALSEGDPSGGGNGGGSDDGDKAVSRDDIKAIVREELGGVREAITEELEDSTGSVEERAKQLLEERDEARILERKAEQLLAEATRNGFSKTAADDIRARYTITPGSGVPASLKVEEDDLTIQESDKDGKETTVTLTAPQVVERRVRADIDHVIGVLRESGANPQVKGFGPSKKDPGSDGGKTAPRQSAFRSWLAERGGLPSDPEKHGDAIREMVQEGIG